MVLDATQGGLPHRRPVQRAAAGERRPPAEQWGSSPPGL